MSLNESIAEDAAPEWLGDPGYAAGHGPHPALSEPAVVRMFYMNRELLYL